MWAGPVITSSDKHPSCDRGLDRLICAAGEFVAFVPTTSIENNDTLSFSNSPFGSPVLGFYYAPYRAIQRYGATRLLCMVKPLHCQHIRNFSVTPASTLGPLSSVYILIAINPASSETRCTGSPGQYTDRKLNASWSSGKIPEKRTYRLCEIK